MTRSIADGHPPDPSAFRIEGPARLVFPGLAGFYGWSFPLSYVLLRVGFGLTILTHGLPKVLGTGHGSMANPMAGSTMMIAERLGLPMASQLAVFVAGLEFLGGLAVAVGLLTRVFAPMLAIQMLAICFALGPTYPWIDRGFEYPLMLGFVALLISLGGSGPLSVDRAIGRSI